MNVRHLAVALILAATQTSAMAGPEQDLFNEMKSLGKAQAGTLQGGIKDGSATAQQPNYNPNPPEKAYYGSNLSSKSSTLQMLCATKPDDPQCAAIAIGNTMRPKTYIPLSDPLLAADGITQNPLTALGSITNAYSACSQDVSVATAAKFSLTTCSLDVNGWNSNPCLKSLTVYPKDKYSCSLGDEGAYGIDQTGYIDSGWYNTTAYYEVKNICEPDRADGKMTFKMRMSLRKTWDPNTYRQDAGWVDLAIDMSQKTPAAGQLPPVVHTNTWMSGGPYTVYAEGPGCNQDFNCSMTFHFLRNVAYQWTYTCPAGQINGDKIPIAGSMVYGEWGGNYFNPTAWADRKICYQPVTGSYAQQAQTCRSATCITNAETKARFLNMGVGSITGYEVPPTMLQQCSAGWFGSPPVCTTVTNPEHRAITLSFQKPHLEFNAGDYWDNQCKPYEDKSVSGALPLDGTNPVIPALPVRSTVAPEQCVRTSSTCMDGPSTRIIDGVSVTRECWKWSNSFDCATLAASSTCNDPALGKCSQTAGVTCTSKDAKGRCLTATAPFECPVTPTAYTTSSVSCGGSTFCADGSCYDTSHEADPDFARAVTYMEAAREAGRYFDPETMRIFKGARSSCTHKLWDIVDCCKKNGSPAGAFSNFAIASAAVGELGAAALSTYTFDALLSSGAPTFVIEGFGQIAGMGFDSVLADVIAGNAGMSELLSSMVPGPWQAAMLIIQLSGILDCDKASIELSMQRQAGICHHVGNYCSSKDPFGGCLEEKEVDCCFPSKLARIINEQGRTQVGRDWGSAKAPACDGFTIAELEKLDFAAMDLTEFYADIVPTMPAVGDIQAKQSDVAKRSACYYGAGKC
jgi:conjugal transfer mating pair stabilization protein TraN